MRELEPAAGSSRTRYCLQYSREVLTSATAGKFTTVLLVANEARVFANWYQRDWLVANEARVFATAGKFATVLLVAIRSACLRHSWKAHDCIACSDRSA